MFKLSKVNINELTRIVYFINHEVEASMKNIYKLALQPNQDGLTFRLLSPTDIENLTIVEKVNVIVLESALKEAIKHEDLIKNRVKVEKVITKDIKDKLDNKSMFSVYLIVRLATEYRYNKTELFLDNIMVKEVGNSIHLFNNKYGVIINEVLPNRRFVIHRTGIGKHVFYDTANLHAVNMVTTLDLSDFRLLSNEAILETHNIEAVFDDDKYHPIIERYLNVDVEFFMNKYNAHNLEIGQRRIGGRTRGVLRQLLTKLPENDELMQLSKPLVKVIAEDITVQLVTEIAPDVVVVY